MLFIALILLAHMKESNTEQRGLQQQCYSLSWIIRYIYIWILDLFDSVLPTTMNMNNKIALPFTKHIEYLHLLMLK